jgi:hypothetical protein
MMLKSEARLQKHEAEEYDLGEYSLIEPRGYKLIEK